MKVLQLAALFGGAVSAVNPLVVYNGVRRDIAATTTEVVLVTSVSVHTTLCLNPPDCPAGATVLVTSTTVVASTTTICSTPGAVLPPPESSSAPMATPVSSFGLTVSGLPVITPGLPVGPSGSAGSSVATSIGLQSSGFSVSIIPGSSVESTVSVVPPTPSGSGSLPPVASSVVTTGFSSVSVSAPSKSSTDAAHTSFPSAPPAADEPTNTHSNGVPTSKPVLSVGSSSDGPASSAEGISYNSGTYTFSQSSSPGQSSVPSIGISVGITVGVSASPSGSYGPSFAISSASVVPSATGPSGSAFLSAFGSSASAFGPSSSAGPYSPSAADTISTTRQGPPGTASEYSSTPTSESTTASRPTLRSTTSDIYGPPTPPTESESPVNSTVRVTSYLTKTMTSVITPAPVSSVPNSTYPVTTTDIEPTDISRGTSASAYPSGSGFAHPSGNGTIVSPRPTYSEIPTNMGQVIGAGKSSLAAIVVALAFAHFA